MYSNLKISVIIPCYNQACFLDECVMSLIKQSYSNWECILVNDGSVDNTEEKSLSWEKRDKRIKYVKKINGGLSSARNLGLNYATGDYIQFLDCDDFLKPEKFSKSIHKISNPENTVVITNFILFDEKLKKSLPPYCILENIYFNQEAILQDWDKKFTIPIHCALFPSPLVRKYKFNEELKAKEDWFFWLQIYENNTKTIFINEPLAFYRTSPSGMTRDEDFMHKNKMIAIQKIETIVNKEFYHSFLRNNNIFYMNENFKLRKEISRLKEKRKLRYKINKFLSIFKLEIK